MAGRSRRGNDSGAAAVEFALVSVVLFPLLFGIIQYGFLFFQSQAASSVVRDAARSAATGISTCPAFITFVGAQADANALDSTDPLWSVAVAYPTAGVAQRGDPVHVTIAFTPLSFGVPFVPLPAAPLTRSAQTVVENVGAETGPC